VTDGFVYKCPDCGSTNILHEQGCKYDYEKLHQFERPYIDILSTLLDYAATMEQYDMNPAMKKELLIQKVEELPNHDKEVEAEDADLLELESVEFNEAQQDIDPPTQEWNELHEDCLSRLIEERRVMETPEGLILTTPEERVEQVIPTFEPLRTIYECGPVDGAKDYSVYTMVSWCALKDMTWEQTCNFIHEWMEDTGAWERESWGEPSVQALLNDKKHVWANDLGWGDMAKAAKGEIDSSDADAQIDVNARIGKEATDYED
jgi:hypothetical protein